MAFLKSAAGREKAARLRAGRRASEQVSAVFLAVRGAERAERGHLRSLVASEAPGGGLMDLEPDSVFELLRTLQDFLRLRAGDRTLLLVIHGDLRVLRSGELAIPLSARAEVTATRLRAVLRAAEIGRQIVVLDGEVSFETPPAGGDEAAYREVLEKAFRVVADDRLVLARRPSDRRGLTRRLAAALETHVAIEEGWLGPEAMLVAVDEMDGVKPMVVGLPHLGDGEVGRSAEKAIEQAESARPRGPGGLARYKRSEAPAASAPESVDAAPAAGAPSDSAVGDGKLHHDIPTRMRVGHSYDVCVAVSRDPSDMVKSGLGSRVSTHELRVAGMMSVTLRDPEDAFEIKEMTETQQPIDHGFARALGFATEAGPDRGFWRFRVTPKRWGDYPLTIHATAFIRDAHGQLIPAPEQNDRIHVFVSVNFGREILRVLKWLSIALVGYLVVDRVGGPMTAGLIEDLRVWAAGLIG